MTDNPADNRILDPRTFAALEVITRAADTTAKVVRTREFGPSDLWRRAELEERTEAIARRLVINPKSAAFLTTLDDIRDAYLRVTTRSGFEAFWAVSELVDDFNVGRFTIYDWS